MSFDLVQNLDEAISDDSACFKIAWKNRNRTTITGLLRQGKVQSLQHN